ncbi:MAG: helix-turn-helix domain-containing protein [Dysgonamonadaceae bacterium]|jgi:transcriptional regulator with XRE-family HTH domain|nr:helix-turn-helix domain-containing protein [Dysgonamonadaceae bacterium]
MEKSGVIKRQPHLGKNVKSLREILGIKQEILAESIGCSQQFISNLENQENIDEKILEKIATVLKNYDEEKTINFIANTFNDTSVGNVVHYYPSFNPIDKLIEVYNLLLKEKDERIAILEKYRRE